MKKLVVFAVLAILSAPAEAGSLTITVVQGANTFTYTRAVADADLTGKFLPFVQANYAGAAVNLQYQAFCTDWFQRWIGVIQAWQTNQAAPVAIQ